MACEHIWKNSSVEGVYCDICAAHGDVVIRSPTSHLDKAERAVHQAREHLVGPNSSQEMTFVAIRLLIAYLKEQRG